MSLTRVNLLNIGLMVVSLGLAMSLPFETFLISYAVLGPLHYLTQISWMHDRQYFSKGKRDWLPLLLLTSAIIALTFYAASDPSRAHHGHTAVSLMVFSVGFSLLLATTKDKVLRWAGAVVCAVVAFLMHGGHIGAVWFGLYLPTLIHVCLFTAAFVVYGALKANSRSALASAIVFFACVLLALLLEPGTLGYVASDYAQEAYKSFGSLHLQLMHDTGRAAQVAATAEPNTQLYPFAEWPELFASPFSLQVGRLIAFAYTYHYLNWFSKTSVIRWHEVPKSRMAAVVVIWLVSVAFYAIDFAAGMKWLLFLSFLHVLLELPLDHKTFLGIGSELLKRVRPKHQVS